MWYMNEDRTLLKKSFTEFAQKRVRPFAKQLEDEEARPKEILKEMGKLGMFTMPIPEEYTGTGPDYISWGLLLEEIKEQPSFLITFLAPQLMQRTGLLFR